MSVHEWNVKDDVMKPMKRIGAACALLLAVSACTNTTTAGGREADRRVMIANETGQTMARFYGSRATTQSWEEDIFDGDVLVNGEKILIDFDDGSDDCIFDLKAEMRDKEEMVKLGIDVCRVSAVTFQ